MSKTILRLLVFILLSSCDVGPANGYKLAYDKILTGFDRVELFGHFPEEVYGAYSFQTVFPSVAKMHGRCGVLLTCTYDNIQQFSEILDSSIQISILGNADNLIVNAGNEVGSAVYQNYSNVAVADSIPIPDIEKLVLHKDQFVRDQLLTSDRSIFMIYVIDAEPGKFLLSEQLTEGKGLPAKWKNGYSRGIALNETENLVIYWLELW